MFIPTSSWTVPKEFISFKDAKRVCIDVETRDDFLRTLGPGTRRGAYIVGVGIGIDDGPCRYYPVRHLDASDNLDPDKVFKWLDSEARSFKGELVGANILYDLDMLAEELVVFPSAKLLDVQVAEALIDENQTSYSLEAISNKYFKTGKVEHLLQQAALEYGLDPKRDLWKLPARFVGEYAEGDVRLPLQILNHQEKEISAQDLTKIWQLEQQVTSVLFKMLRYGIRVDEAKLEQCREYFAEQEAKTYVQLKHLTGHDLKDSINASARIAGVLKERGIVLPKLEGGKDSVTKPFLEQLDDPVAKLIMRARRFNKAQGTFYKSIKDRLIGDRLYPTFHQLRSDEGGTVTGRLSSSNPNIQQQPSRTPTHEDDGIARMWRSIYIAEEHSQFLRADYKAQEPRLFLHYAVKLKALGAKEMAQKYKDNPYTDPYNMLCPDIPKDDIKIIYLGRSYGMGDGKLHLSVARSLINRGIRENVDEKVSEILRQFELSAPYFRETTYKVMAVAGSRGYITTIGGRRCRFPNGEFVHKATNRLIQGSAADQTKKAMVDLAQVGWIPHMQIHDELCFSVPNDGAALTIKQIMETSTSLEVPVVVDFALANNWGECK